MVTSFIRIIAILMLGNIFSLKGVLMIGTVYPETLLNLQMLLFLKLN